MAMPVLTRAVPPAATVQSSALHNKPRGDVAETLMGSVSVLAGQTWQGRNRRPVQSLVGAAQLRRAVFAPAKGARRPKGRT